MKLVKVLIPFVDGETGTLHETGKEVELSETTIERALAINVNMLLVIGDAKPKAKPRAKKEIE
jgi:hypothetical protein